MGALQTESLPTRREAINTELWPRAIDNGGIP